MTRKYPFNKRFLLWDKLAMEFKPLPYRIRGYAVVYFAKVCCLWLIYRRQIYDAPLRGFHFDNCYSWYCYYDYFHYHRLPLQIFGPKWIRICQKGQTAVSEGLNACQTAKSIPIYDFSEEGAQSCRVSTVWTDSQRFLNHATTYTPSFLWNTVEHILKKIIFWISSKKIYILQ